MLLSRGHNGKRICVNAAFENFEPRNHPSIKIFIDKFLLEVFKRLPSGKETSVCACVSKRWLTLLWTVHKDEIVESNGYLARSLLGRKVTIVKLVAIVVRTSNRGDLAKLSIRGNNLRHGVTYIGLKDISRGSPTLKEHSLWNVSYVGDEGLSESAHECHLSEKLDLFQCPRNSLFESAHECHLSEKLDLFQCPRNSLSESAYECHLSEKLDLFQCPRNRGPDGSSSLERKILDVVCRMTNSSMTHPCDPNLVPSWKRSFDILGALKFVPWMLNNFIQAHPLSRVRRKVYERYIALVESICSKDLVMRTLINDDELLVLASTALCSDSQNIA